MPSEDIAAKLEQLATRVRELEDKEAIRQLTARYNDAFDDMDIDGYAATFTPDGALVLGDAEIAGHEALKAFHREIGFGKVHATVDHNIEVDGDRARQVCNLVLGSRQSDQAVGSAKVDNTGRYRDELVRTPDGWRFQRRTWFPDAQLPS